MFSTAAAQVAKAQLAETLRQGLEIELRNSDWNGWRLASVEGPNPTPRSFVGEGSGETPQGPQVSLGGVVGMELQPDIWSSQCPSRTPSLAPCLVQMECLGRQILNCTRPLFGHARKRNETVVAHCSTLAVLMSCDLLFLIWKSESI